jgi:hypothetical protein
MSRRIPDNIGEGSLGIEGGLEALESREPTSLELEYAMRSTLIRPESRESRLLPFSEIFALEVMLVLS